MSFRPKAVHASVATQNETRLKTALSAGLHKNLHALALKEADTEVETRSGARAKTVKMRNQHRPLASLHADGDATRGHIGADLRNKGWEQYYNSTMKMNIFPDEPTRVTVKLMGSATPGLAAQPTNTLEAFMNVIEDHLSAFQQFYTHMVQVLGASNFDFITDGDPADKPDLWKAFLVYASTYYRNNTVTGIRIAETDENKVKERERTWKILGVDNYSIQNPKLRSASVKDTTFNRADAIMSIGIVRDKTVYDATKRMLMDGPNFIRFQIKGNDFIAFTSNGQDVHRQIVGRQERENSFSDTEELSREEMQVHLQGIALSDLVVVSTGGDEYDSIKKGETRGGKYIAYYHLPFSMDDYTLFKKVNEIEPRRNVNGLSVG